MLVVLRGWQSMAVGGSMSWKLGTQRRSAESASLELVRKGESQAPGPQHQGLYFITKSLGDSTAHQSLRKQCTDVLDRCDKLMFPPRAMAKPTCSKPAALAFAQNFPPSLLCIQTHPRLLTLDSTTTTDSNLVPLMPQHIPTLPVLGFLSSRQSLL